MSRPRLLLLKAMLIAGFTVGAQAQSPAVELERGFQSPPDSAKPRVWWHWMNGNITKEGIQLDLEWMKRAGIGGFQNFDASLLTPPVVPKRLVYMTPEWKDAFLFATKLADQLGLEEAIAGSPGWSESGGPWVKPAQAMKKLVWSETMVEGGRPFTGVLPNPSAVSGPFQNIPFQDYFASLMGQTPPKLPQYYADSAVVVYRVPESDVPMPSLHPKVTVDGKEVDAALLSDGDLVKFINLPAAPAGQKASMQIEFAAPQKIRALTLAVAGVLNPFAPAPPGPDFEASDDGVSYRLLAHVPGDGAAQHTITFPEAVARWFRVTFTTPTTVPGLDLGIDLPQPKPPKNYKITELVLHTGARVNRAEEKAGFATLPDLYEFPTTPCAKEDVIAKSGVVDLTSKLRPDGTLDWTPPVGRWMILRLGYSLLGISNHPASPEGTGFEVDKLNAEHVRSYMTTYLDNYKSAVGDLMGKRGLQYLISDSYEAGAQNWTDNLIAEFTRRRGYDPHPWLPVLTGRVVESSESSDRFLWDFRRTLYDLIAENHYDLIGKMLHERGMGHYGESHESGRAFLGDGMEAKRTNDVPMSAMWTQSPGVNKEQYGYNADIRESAAVAHIYGQNLVAAESMTASSGAWSWSPATLKPTADKELAMGLNRFVIHTSVHQPLLDKTPGLGLGPFGQWFTRNETWAEQAKAWVTYLARNSYLLQQGRFVADIAYFYGEDSNLTALFNNKSPDVPAGYNFDFVNADALLHEFKVDAGQLATPSGMRYRVLALDAYAKQMSLPVLRKIKDLVSQGAIVVGAKPAGTPSLRDDAAEFRAIADELWGANKLQGRVTGSGLTDALAALDIARDFEHTKPQPDTELLYVHRHLPGADLYFVDNRRDRFESLDATFRVAGREAELWHPDTGAIEPASFQIANGRTTVPLQLEPWGTVFVVFRKPTRAVSRILPKQVDASLATIDGPWEVRFQPGRGAPEHATFDKLISWPDYADAGVKYFSGIGTYTKTLSAPKSWFTSGTRLWLDLGDVKNLAEVAVNGKLAGIVWKTPYRVELTGMLRPGDNTLEVHVINAWVNRMIGDRQPGATKITFTRPEFYKPDSPLQPSGLLGPVQVIGVGQALSPAKASLGRR